MANIIRIGDTLMNLDYLASTRLAPANGTPAPVESVYMDCGRVIYFEGPDAEAVRRLVRSFPEFPESGEGPGGVAGLVEYSTGVEVPLPHRSTGKVAQAE